MNQLALFHKPPGGYRFDDPQRLKEFILAGKAKFTLQSHKTTKHFTYKVKAASADCWYVSRLGIEEYIYLGTIFSSTGFQATRKTSPTARMSEQFHAFFWFWAFLIKEGRIPKTLTVYHEGRCGMCGTVLTDPESINQGYGPECRKKLFARPSQNKRPVG